MDKNMINIDDLLKQRLTDGEEKERPGAWLQMRELLDKEMPVAPVPPAASLNRRRMFGYAAALLLLSALGVGGYQMLSSVKDDKAAYDTVLPALPEKAGAGIIEKHPANTAANTNTSNPIDNTLGDTSNPFRNKNKNNINAVAATQENESKIAGASGSANAQPTAHATTTNTTATTAKTTTKNNKTANSGKASAQSADGDKLLNDSRKSALMASVNSGNATKPAVLTTETTNHNKSQQNTTDPAGNRQFASGKNLPKSGNTLGDVAANNNKPARQATGSETQSTAKNNQQAAGNHQPVVPNTASKNGKKPVSGNVNPDYLVSKQLVPTIEVRETYDRKEGWKLDTISKGRAEMEVLTPAEKSFTNTLTGNSAEKQGPAEPANKAQEPVTATAKRSRPMITVREEDNIPTPVVPSSAMALNTNTENSETLVPLANFKVSSKQSSNYARTGFIEQMVKNAKVNLGSAKFYGGIIGGVNTSLSGNNSMWGFQLGLSGTLSLNERWGIVSELKYLHRFNSKPLRNDGYSNLDSSAAINNMVTYTWDSVNRSFKFPVVSAMELPVYIRYSLNRLNFHAGMNLVYNFTVNNIDIDSFGIRMRNNEGPVLQGAVNYSFQDGVPRIAIEDFASRFSIGYLFGVGYQFTPAIQLDVRMTQPLWDNAKSNGAKQVSKQLYNVPSVQVNLNYRFGNNKFKPYRK